jgi:hypothetical protein
MFCVIIISPLSPLLTLQKETYPPGEYTFPFAIQLPLNLPPSDPAGKYCATVKDDSDENSFRHTYSVSYDQSTLN